MSDYPHWLPSILDLDNKSINEIIDILYSVFVADFKNKPVFHDKCKVLFNSTIDQDCLGKEKVFWHVISKNDKDIKDRLIDYRRAERLPWAKPLMQTKNSDVLIFDYDHGSKDVGIRRYIWLYKYDYVVILKKKKNIYYWITAFYIHHKSGKIDLANKYKNRL